MAPALLLLYRGGGGCVASEGDRNTVSVICSTNEILYILEGERVTEDLFNAQYSSVMLAFTFASDPASHTVTATVFVCKIKFTNCARDQTSIQIPSHPN